MAGETAQRLARGVVADNYTWTMNSTGTPATYTSAAEALNIGSGGGG